MPNLLQDTRYGLRMLLRSPSFTAVSVLCLGLGIGATTAIFTVVDAVVMKPLPYTGSARMVRIYTDFPNFPGGGLHKFWLSPPEYLTLKKEVTRWESIEGWVNNGSNLSGGQIPIRVTTCFLSGGLLPSLGVSPVRGRLVEPNDDHPGVTQTAVISYGLWRSSFAGDESIAGKQVLLDGNKTTVVGVMPKGFQFLPGEVDAPDLWVPLQLDPANPGNSGGHYLSIVGKLKSGISFETGQDELKRLVAHWGEAAGPKTHVLSPKFHPLTSFPFQNEVTGSVRPAMLMMLGAVGFVLLIACVNVANLLLARAQARQKEIAVRKALGAAASGLFRQFVIEGLLLSLAGAAVGLVLAFGGLRLIVSASAGSIPRAGEIAVDTRVLLFTLAVCCATGLFFGLAPLAQIIRTNLSDALKAAAGRNTASAEAHQLRRVMVIAEVALALVLLIGTGLMVRAFWNLQAVNAGINPHGLLTMRVALPQAVYPDGTRLRQFWSIVQERMAQLPGVTSASMMSGLPPVRLVNANDTSIEGFVQKKDGPIQLVDYYNTVGNHYFETIGARLVEGRFFDNRDGDGATPSVIVNQTMARTFFPGETALGHRLMPGGEKQWRTIVGVIGDIKNAGIDKPTGTEIFIPYAQVSRGTRGATIVLRTSGDPRALAGAAREQIARIDPSLPIANMRTMDEVMMRAESRPRFLTMLLSIFSGVALVLAGIGIYGVISYSVEQRTNEFGIRMALGAGPGSVLGMVIRQGLVLGAAGVVAGAIGATWLTRFLRGLLFGVDSFDPATFIVMAILLLAVTSLACYIPARRATRVDPMIALRYE